MRRQLGVAVSRGAGAWQGDTAGQEHCRLALPAPAMALSSYCHESRRGAAPPQPLPQDLGATGGEEKRERKPSGRVATREPARGLSG